MRERWIYGISSEMSANCIYERDTCFHRRVNERCPHIRHRPVISAIPQQILNNFTTFHVRVGKRLGFFPEQFFTIKITHRREKDVLIKRGPVLSEPRLGWRNSSGFVFLAVAKWYVEVWNAAARPASCGSLAPYLLFAHTLIKVSI